MGKKIIVKGADFSVNGFRSPVSGSLTIYNYALSLIADGDNYGNINTSSYPKTRWNSPLNNICNSSIVPI